MDDEVEAPLDQLEVAQDDDLEESLGDAGVSTSKYTYNSYPSSG